MTDVSPLILISHDGAILASAVAFGSVLTYGCIRIVQKIRDRRELRHAAMRREEKFRLLVQGVSDTAIYMLDVDGTVSNWAPSVRMPTPTTPTRGRAEVTDAARVRGERAMSPG